MNNNEILNNNSKVKNCNIIPSNLKTAYEAFDWIYYTEYYNYVAQKNITDKLTAWTFWYESENEENNLYFVVPKKEKIVFDTFDWKTYILINEDLSNLNRMEAWKHWIEYGIKESRGFKRVNCSCIHKARFGNLFFINMAIHFIAIKNNLLVSYKYNKKFIELGIRFFVGRKTYDDDICLTDSNFFDIITSDKKCEKNIVIDINKLFCQKPKFVLFIKDKFNDIFKENIKKKNIFKHRYNKNKDIFIHVRLGDLTDNLCFDGNQNYYDNILSTITFDNAFISSDSIENPLCKFLIKKYNLTIINYDEVKTIMFASTCDKIILSGGTFSWLIGFLAFYSSKIYYPKYAKTWYDDIFIFDDWIETTV